MIWNRVWAIGRETYIRIYPNPGVGVCVGKYRVALSWYGGLEVFARHPVHCWKRSHCWLDRRKKPKGK
jgi:hypothetical protein